MFNKVFNIAGSNLIAGLIAFFVSVYPSFFLTAEQYGKYSQFYVVIGFATLICSISSNVTFSYMLANKKANKQTIISLLNKVDLYAICIIVLFFILTFTLNIISPLYFYGVLVAGFSVRLLNLSGIYLGSGDYYKHNISILIRFAPVAIVFILLMNFLSDENDFAIAHIFCAIIIYIISVNHKLEIPRDIDEFEGPEFNFSDLIKYGFWALLSTITYMIGIRGFVFILSYFESDAESGVFFLFLAILEAVLIIPSAIGKFYFSKYGSKQKLAKKDLIITLIIVFLFSLMIVVLSKVLSIIIEQYYISSSIYFNVLDLLVYSFFLLLFNGFLKVISQINCANGNVKVTFYGSLASSLIAISLGIYFISIFGLIGVIYSLTIGAIINFIINLKPNLINKESRL